MNRLFRIKDKIKTNVMQIKEIKQMFVLFCDNRSNIWSMNGWIDEVMNQWVDECMSWWLDEMINESNDGSKDELNYNIDLK